MFLTWWQIALIIYFSCNIGCTMMLFVKSLSKQKGQTLYHTDHTEENWQ